jgi:hypothetical protein
MAEAHLQTENGRVIRNEAIERFVDPFGKMTTFVRRNHRPMSLSSSLSTIVDWPRLRPLHRRRF